MDFVVRAIVFINFFLSVRYFSKYMISVTVLCSEIVTEIECCWFLN